MKFNVKEQTIGEGRRLWLYMFPTEPQEPKEEPESQVSSDQVDGCEPENEDKEVSE